MIPDCIEYKNLEEVEGFNEFRADMAVHDGTENGTTLVVDIWPGTMGNGEGFPSNPSHITVFNDYMYFTATNHTVSGALWKSDGTANGTSLVKDIADKVNWVAGDIMDLSNLIRTVKQYRIERIIRFSAVMSGPLAANPFMIYRINVDGMVNILDIITLINMILDR